MLQVLTTPVQPDLHSHVCIHITLPSLVLKSLRWKYAVDWGQLDNVVLCLCSTTDIDECATRQNNCTKDQMCINTYGGFQCVRVDCPKIPNATYIKTSPM